MYLLLATNGCMKSVQRVVSKRPTNIPGLPLFRSYHILFLLHFPYPPSGAPLTSQGTLIQVHFCLVPTFRYHHFMIHAHSCHRPARVHGHFWWLEIFGCSNSCAEEPLFIFKCVFCAGRKPTTQNVHEGDCTHPPPCVWCYCRLLI